jgi:hypothetical protein
MHMYRMYIKEISCSQNFFELSALIRIESSDLFQKPSKIHLVWHAFFKFALNQQSHKKTKSPERLYWKKNMGCMGPYAGFDYNSPIVNSVVSYPPPLQRERGAEWGRSLLSFEHIYICLQISKTTNMNKGEGRGDLMSLNWTFYGAWATWADFNPTL